jgi:hypothetical protein
VRASRGRLRSRVWRVRRQMRIELGSRRSLASAMCWVHLSKPILVYALLGLAHVLLFTLCQSICHGT